MRNIVELKKTSSAPPCVCCGGLEEPAKTMMLAIDGQIRHILICHGCSSDHTTRIVLMLDDMLKGIEVHGQI